VQRSAVRLGDLGLSLGQGSHRGWGGWTGGFAGAPYCEGTRREKKTKEVAHWGILPTRKRGSWRARICVS